MGGQNYLLKSCKVSNGGPRVHAPKLSDRWLSILFSQLHQSIRLCYLLEQSWHHSRRRHIVPFDALGQLRHEPVHRNLRAPGHVRRHDQIGSAIAQ